MGPFCLILRRFGGLFCLIFTTSLDDLPAYKMTLLLLECESGARIAGCVGRWPNSRPSVQNSRLPDFPEGMTVMETHQPLGGAYCNLMLSGITAPHGRASRDLL
jgi:hypothetical protein